jgi:hypothetical protein
MGQCKAVKGDDTCGQPQPEQIKAVVAALPRAVTLILCHGFERQASPERSRRGEIFRTALIKG